MSGAGYRTELGQGLVLDDRLWQLSIGVERHFFEVRQQQAMSWTHDENLLAHMIHLGTRDHRTEHRASDASVRAMRFSAIMSERLWGMLDIERARVCPDHCFVLILN
jgi:hypothetical protein